MHLPDCYEADRQEDRRQARYDAKCARYPQCACCGRSVYRGSTYRRIGDFFFCEDCDDGSEVGAVEDLFD
ncbi:MAG: hypothetical protein E7438_03205 [Ruminococcaceae bacterium]|nr:hypothetical protein [Oscillospiraceae bacterium]